MTRRFIPVFLALLLALSTLCAYAGGEALEIDPTEYLKQMYNEATEAEKNYGEEAWTAKLQELVDQYRIEIEEDPSFAARGQSSTYYRYAKAVIELYREEPDYRQAENDLILLGTNDLHRSDECLLLARGMRELEDGNYYEGISDLLKVQSKFTVLSPRIGTKIDEAVAAYREEIIGLLQSGKTVQEVQGEYNKFIQLFPGDDEINGLWKSLEEARQEEEEQPAGSLRYRQDGEAVTVSWDEDGSEKPWTVEILLKDEVILEQETEVPEVTFLLNPGKTYECRVNRKTLEIAAEELPKRKGARPSVKNTFVQFYEMKSGGSEAVSEQLDAIEYTDDIGTEDGRGYRMCIWYTCEAELEAVCGLSCGNLIDRQEATFVPVTGSRPKGVALDLNPILSQRGRDGGTEIEYKIYIGQQLWMSGEWKIQ